jgi:hypothetical protein
VENTIQRLSTPIDEGDFLFTHFKRMKQSL